MALISSDTKDGLPKGAVRLSRQEVLTHLENAIENYHPQSEVFFLNYGSYVLGAAAAVSGFAILRQFRQALVLTRDMRYSSYLPTMWLPATGSHILHILTIRDKVVLQDRICPVCLETRSAALQLVSGLALPVGLSVLASSMGADRAKNFNMPSLSKKPREFLKFWVTQTKSAKTMFAGVFALQLAAGMAVTYLEGKESYVFHRRLRIRAELNEHQWGKN